MDWYVYMLRREAAIKKLPRAKKLELTEENCDA